MVRGFCYFYFYYFYCSYYYCYLEEQFGRGSPGQERSSRGLGIWRSGVRRRRKSRMSRVGDTLTIA